MKKILFLTLVLLTFFQSCSSHKDGSESITIGAVAIYDAANMLGNGSVPGSGCANTTWVNLQDSSLNANINCASGGGFAGAGNAADPYRITFNGTTTSAFSAVATQASTLPSATWIVWVNPTSIASLQHILSIDNHAGAFNRSLIIDSSSWGVFNGTGTFVATAADANTWQQIAVVFTPTNIILYKNGTPVTYGSAPVNSNTALALTIGRSAGGNFDFFQGSIAWVGIYSRALNQTEISNSCKAMMPNFTGVLCN